MRQAERTTKIARRLRQKATDAENCLWQILRNKRLTGFRFRRQHPVGKYIADFACIKYRLIVELDGGQHDGNARDVVRTAWLGKAGWRVLRFWNHEVLTNQEGVFLRILDELGARGKDFEGPSPSQIQEDLGPSLSR